MTNVDERLFMLDLAIVQLIAGILVTLGSTLLAISIGFGLSISTDVQEAILQILAMQAKFSPEVQQTLIQESLSNYVLVLAIIGIALISTGVLFASVKTKKIRKQIKEDHKIANLIATDIRKTDNVKIHTERLENQAASAERLSKDRELSIGLARATEKKAIEMSDKVDN